jgi:phosphoglycolate phosphatase
MLFIFDWDGTISDSASRIISCIKAAAENYGLPDRSELEIKNIIGLAMREASLTLYPDLSEADIQRFHEIYAAIYVEKDAKPCELFPGVLATLDQLKTHNYTLSVATGKSRKGLDRVLKGLSMDDYFHHSRCADESASKPDPLMLRQILDESGASAGQAVMVGDTEWDMRMADELGMKKIAVSYGAHSRTRLEACRPDWLIDDFSQILEWRF